MTLARHFTFASAFWEQFCSATKLASLCSAHTAKTALLGFYPFQLHLILSFGFPELWQTNICCCLGFKEHSKAQMLVNEPYITTLKWWCMSLWLNIPRSDWKKANENCKQKFTFEGELLEEKNIWNGLLGGKNEAHFLAF